MSTLFFHKKSNLKGLLKNTFFGTLCVLYRSTIVVIAEIRKRVSARTPNASILPYSDNNVNKKVHGNM